MNEADKALESAILDIKGAIKSLSKIVIDECEGDIEFIDEFRDVMRESLNELIIIKTKLEKDT